MRLNDYKSCYDMAAPTYEQKQRMLNVILGQKNESEGTITMNSRKKRMSAAVALAAVLCLLLSVTAMAAFIPGFNYLISQISPEIAQFLHPVEGAQIADGLKMEVVGAMRDENTVIVYLTVQDLTGDRIDDAFTVSEYDIPGGFITTQRTVAYDDQTKTATMCLVVEDLGGLKDDGMTLRINAIGKMSIPMFDSGLDLTNIATTGNTVPLEVIYGMSGAGEDNQYDYYRENSVKVLLPDEMRIPVRGADYGYISNIGFVDGHLHVQVNHQRTGLDNYLSNRRAMISNFLMSKAPVDEIPSGYFYLYSGYDHVVGTVSFDFAVDERGNPTQNSFLKDEDGIPNNYYTHTEVIFNDAVTRDELSEYRLFASIYSEDIIEGDWQFSFKIEPERIISAQCNIGIEDVHVDRFAISPFRIYISGSGTVSNEAPFEILITMKDGNIEKYGAVMSRNAKGDIHLTLNTWEVTSAGEYINRGYSTISTGTLDTRDSNNDIADMRLMPAFPIDIDNIEQITLNSSVISFN